MKDYLAACLDSAVVPGLAGEYEIVAVNDGCTDSSPEILAEYTEKYPGIIRTVTKKNGGLGSARNAALPVAEGEFVFFLDSDDTLPEDTVREMVETCRNGNFDICFFDMEAVDEKGTLLEHVTGANMEGCFTLEENPDILLCRMNACNKLFRRSLFIDNNLRFRDREWYEDVSLVPGIYPLAKKMYYAPRVWYKYLMRSGSIMNNKKLERNLEITSALNAMCSQFRQQGLFEKYHDYLEYAAFYNGLVAATVRINLAVPLRECSAGSPAELQNGLLDWFLKSFPDYRQNRFVQTMPVKYKLLDFLITHRMRKAVHMVMSTNAAVRR